MQILQAANPWTAYSLKERAERINLDYTTDSNIEHINPSAKRLFQLFMQYETISRLRYNRGSGRLMFQKDLEGLSRFIMQSRWYREALKRLSSSDIYGFSESQFIRILMTIQTGAHFFEVPYPALFCLFFQESKLDFKVVSRTGAKGVGQLTSIGLLQSNKLRKRSLHERKLQSAAKHLNQVYHDPVVLKWLNLLEMSPKLPKINPIPEQIKFTRINSSFINKIGKELVRRGHQYGKNIGLVWVLSKKIRRGDILPDRYAHAHGVFSELLEKEYAQSQASVYNIETNILLSIMLFNHYYRYRWGSNLQRFDLDSDIRIMLAIAAYNHGQSGIRRYLINLKHEFPMLVLKDLSVRKLQLLFTTRRLSRALRRPYRKVREASRHVRKVMECAEQQTIDQLISFR